MKNQNLFKKNQAGRIFRSAAVCGLATLALMTSACGSKNASFSLLADTANFQQNSAFTNGKIDILWVIDNSGSMDSSQRAVAENFARFIEKFTAKGFDYRMAVTTTDAFMDLYGYPASQSKFRDGTDKTSHSGYFIIDPNTPNLENVFLTNILQGIEGSGDERAFQSIERTLTNPMNAGFPRPDAFLSVIIVSDEDDFSYDGARSIGGQYSNPSLHPVDHYVGFLDNIMGATDETRSRKYNVNSIAILDKACQDYLNLSSSGRKIGYRYIELADKTSGVKASLCDDFGTSMSDISNRIIELTTQFYLNREPNPATIQIIVDGQVVPNDPLNGYQYHPDTNSVTFHGSYVPGPGAAISVKFDPVSLK